METIKSKIGLPKRNLAWLKWGVAGCGKYLENSFLPNLKTLKRNNLVAVYSSDLDRAKFISNKFNADKAFNDFEEFLKADFDAVYISSRNSDHSWQVIAAAKAGKHILCEKPIAINTAEAFEMVKTCSENNVLLTLNYVYRYNPLVIKAKELIDKQVIGKIVSISTNLNIDYSPSDNFRFNKAESGGGALRDLGSHMIDLLLYFGGEISDIKGNIDNIIYKGEVEDFANGIVKFKNSGYGYFNVSYNAKKPINRIEILGYNGSISIDNLVGRKNASSKIIIDLSGEARKAFKKKANNQGLLIKEIQKCFLQNKTPKVTGNDALINLQLMERLESE
ncbi:MAG: gfo/Idh/MocA family oxidoreductase [Ignavibacteriae bacterium HGW-Ignavibacteriae-2]|jgi:predicted dehydrogenase|nr:MAG: gfo/Idh/MocA family oxidoreductase [Ignavibacteriae bacterium HGW-Ignavibacteriae-2]